MTTPLDNRGGLEGVGDWPTKDQLKKMGEMPLPKGANYYPPEHIEKATAPIEADKELDEAILFIKEHCLDVSDPSLVWFDFNKAKASLLEYMGRVRIEELELMSAKFKADEDAILKLAGMGKFPEDSYIHSEKIDERIAELKRMNEGQHE